MTNITLQCKRTILATLVICLIAATCGCENQGDGDHVEVVLLANPGSDQEMAAQRDAIARFEQDNPGFRVRIISATGREYYTKAMTMMAGKARIDVLWLGQGFGMFAARGALLDLDSLIREDKSFDIREYDTNVLKWYQYNGRLFGFPSGIDARTIAYNKDLFDRYGIDYPSDSWTVEEYLETARLLTRDSDQDGQIDIFGTGGYPHWTAFNASLLSPDQTRFSMNTAAGLRYLNYIQNMIWSDSVTPSNIEAQTQSPDRYVAFYQQKLAMTTINTYDLINAQREIGFEWSLAPMPREVACGAWGSSSGYAIASYSPHPKQAWALIKALTAPEVQSRAAAFTIPSYLALQNDYRESEPVGVNKSVFVDQIGCLAPTPRIKRQQEVISEWNYWFQLVERNEITPREALIRAEQQINSILDN